MKQTVPETGKDPDCQTQAKCHSVGKSGLTMSESGSVSASG